MTPELHIFKHRDDVGPGWLLDVLRDGPDPFRLCTVRSPDDFPIALACSGVVIVGRSLADMDPADRSPLLRAELAFVRTAVGLGIPYLGLGDGALLLARAMLGRVAAACTTAIGFREAPLTAAGRDDPLLGGRESLPAADWPCRKVALPPRAVLLAGAPEEPAAFRLVDAAWGVVPHPEVTPAAFGDWLAEPGALGDAVTAHIDRPALVAELEARAAVQREAAYTMARRFLARTRRFCHVVPPSIDESPHR
ncbi:MAG: hypothetical protein HY907_04905 [Deltaproteobacteria bacterium]|nr:hypothetical protein [Deltaproteobacteria bacterium]